MENSFDSDSVRDNDCARNKEHKGYRDGNRDNERKLEQWNG